jgi:hypothetical protein
MLLFQNFWTLSISNTVDGAYSSYLSQSQPRRAIPINKLEIQTADPSILSPALQWQMANDNHMETADLHYTQKKRYVYTSDDTGMGIMYYVVCMYMYIQVPKL